MHSHCIISSIILTLPIRKLLFMALGLVNQTPFDIVEKQMHNINASNTYLDVTHRDHQNAQIGITQAWNLFRVIVLRHFSLFSVAIIDILGLTENFLYSGNDTYNQPVYLIIQYYSTELNDLCYSMHNDKPNSTSAAVHECQDRIVNVIEYSKSSIKCIHIMICSRISHFFDTISVRRMAFTLCFIW